MHFDHAGIATQDIEELTEVYTDLLEWRVAHRERFDGMEVRFLGLGDNYVELLEPHDGGPIARFLESNGPGVHHLAFATSDIEGALERATDLGVELIDEEPRMGAWGHEIAFLHPKDTGGALVEFVRY